MGSPLRALLVATLAGCASPEPLPETPVVIVEEPDHEDSPAAADLPTPAPASTLERKCTEDRDPAAAKLEFVKGTTAFREGRYEQALASFESAYELACTRHVLLANLSRVAELLGDPQTAADYLELYLELDDDVPEREVMERKIESLRSER